MKPIRTLFALFLTLLLAPNALAQQAVTENYPPHPDSQPQPGVPKGEVLKFTFENSKIFPGTWREYWVYVPAQYAPDNPACVYVNQDGVQWQAPVVFDNLIHKKEMPVTIATGGFMSRRGSAFRSAIRQGASTPLSPRRTAASQTSHSAAKTSTRSLPPAATTSTNAN